MPLLLTGSIAFGRNQSPVRSGGFPVQHCVECAPFGHLGTHSVLCVMAWLFPNLVVRGICPMGTASDGHHEGSASVPLLGEAGKFPLCVRCHPVLAAWLHGTCSSQGKTLNFCISFLYGYFFVCLASLKSFSDFAPRVWPGCLSYGVCRGKSRESRSSCHQVCFLRGLLAPSRVSKQSSDHSLPQFSHL